MTLSIVSGQVERKRIPFDAVERKAFMLQLAGHDPKDGYVTLFCSDIKEKVQEMYHKFPEVPGCRLRMINANGRPYKGFSRYMSYKYSPYAHGSTYDFEEQSQEFYETVVNAFEYKYKIIEQEENKIKDDLVKIAARETKKHLLRKFIERMANSVKPQLKVINGGIH